MKLCHLTSGDSRVFADIRAALMSLGRGTGIVSGIALIGVSAPNNSTVIDAIVLLPHKVLLIVGVDLPGPVLSLEAPYDDVWQADGWPLTDFEGSKSGFVNPAHKALTEVSPVIAAVSESVRGRPVETVVAIGPYAENISQPESDTDHGIRILYPNPAAILSAVRSHSATDFVYSTTEIRVLLRVLNIELPDLTDEQLVAAGFTAEAPAAIPPTPSSYRGVSDSVKPSAEPSTLAWQSLPDVNAVTRRRKVLPTRSRGLAAVVLGMCALLVGAAVVAFTSGKPSREIINAAPPTTLAQPSTDSQPLAGKPSSVTEALLAMSEDQRCASHASGELQNSLRKTSCTRVQRASVVTTVDYDQIAITIADISFADGTLATAFAALAEKPDNGTIKDVANESKKWPAEPPTFADAAQSVTTDGNQTRIIRAVWLGKPSRPDDPVLNQVAETHRTFSFDEQK